MIMVREPGDSAPDVIEYRHGLTPPMRDARKRRFRREPDLNVLNPLELIITLLICCVLSNYKCNAHDTEVLITPSDHHNVIRY